MRNIAMRLNAHAVLRRPLALASYVDFTMVLMASQYYDYFAQATLGHFAQTETIGHCLREPDYNRLF